MNDLTLYGLSADGGKTFWTDGGKRPPLWGTPAGMKVLNDGLESVNNESFPYRFTPICTLSEALAAREMVSALADARARLASFIGTDCECDNTHAANNTTCCLCEYAAAIKKAGHE